jgi:hypothetical protein
VKTKTGIKRNIIILYYKATFIKPFVVKNWEYPDKLTQFKEFFNDIS